LTPDDVDDISEMSNLLDRIDAGVASMMAEGAYDCDAVYNAVAEASPGCSGHHSSTDSGRSRRSDSCATRQTSHDN
jgi:hypothetical protein